MRTILIAIILAVATLHGYAQNAAGNFLPRANDEVKRQQVAYVAANEGAENTVWDFTQLECSGREYPACYAEEDAYEGQIVGTKATSQEDRPHVTRISRFLGLEYDDENGWKHNK